MGACKTKDIQADLGIFTYIPAHQGNLNIFKFPWAHSGILRHIQV